MADTELRNELYEASRMTKVSIQNVITTMQLQELSRLALPEIERLSDEVARVAPAGNVPGLILSTLTQLEGRNVQENESRRHVGLLLRGVRQTLDKAIYGTFFAGPAAVIYGYQQLLRLAGKELDSAFKEGTWQFYLEFALREDTARHANETIGFHRALHQHNIQLSDGDMLASWLLATHNVIYQLPAIIKNEWREHTILKLLADIAIENKIRNIDDYIKLRQKWIQQRPFSRSQTNHHPFAQHRHEFFEAFYTPYLSALRGKLQKEFSSRYQVLESERLQAYKQQMTWLAYLNPDSHSETRVPYDLQQAQIAVIWKGNYYLIPLKDLANITHTRRLALAILAENGSSHHANVDDVLVRIPREEHARLIRQMGQTTKQELDNLRFAPIIINWDKRDVRQPLSAIRRGKRGVGDHAMTIFHTQESMVFDLSHIFFDGAWGAGLAEVLTNEAIEQANMLNGETRIRFTGNPPAPHSPKLHISPQFINKIKTNPIPIEASADSQFTIDPILSLRRLLKHRSDLAQITVNDLFILFRGIHTLSYQMSPSVIDRIEALGRSRKATHKQAYQATIGSIKKTSYKNPAIMIPIDASAYDPKQRIFPTTFRNPFTDFWHIHQETMSALHGYEEQHTRASRKAFEEAQGNYLRMVGGFGQLLTRYKEIATQGESASNASIKALAHIHPAIQRLLDNIPGRFDMLNEVIKGEEVFSNVGKVVAGSTLRRFASAKDDNQLKMFSWGVITDNTDMVHISLRDFRSHVSILFDIGEENLAHAITQDYLDSYVAGLLQYVTDLRKITVTTTKRKFNFFG